MQLVTFGTNGATQAGVALEGHVFATAELGPYPSTVKSCYR